MLTLTPKAVEKINEFLKKDETQKGKSLRLKVAPSGCAGYEYRIGLDDKSPSDKVLPQSGFDVVVDPDSLQYVEQATIDYSESETSSGFQIKNPMEKSSCGCGKSKQF